MRKGIKALVFLLGGGVALSLICSNFAQAATSTRQSNIKSHGVFVGQDSDSDQEVVLDSADLLYLASECDRLETLVDALSMKQDANIVYTYHYHIGDDRHNGGCYTNGYHEHLSSCAYTTVTVHTHKEGANGCYTYSAPYWKHDYPCLGPDVGCPGHPTKYLTCTQSTTKKVYSCGEPVNRYKLTCGYKDGEIEKAEIVFAPAGD